MSIFKKDQPVPIEPVRPASDSENVMRMRRLIADLQEAMDTLKVHVQYLQLDVEATSRERDDEHVLSQRWEDYAMWLEQEYHHQRPPNPLNEEGE